MRKNILKFAYALALLLVAALPAETSAQFINPGFESGTFSGWTVTSNSSVTTGFNQQNWLVTPANTRMARIEPASGTTRSTTESFLGLSAGSLTGMNSSVLNGSTNFGSIKQSVYLAAGQTVTAYWNYVSQDYSPYNDGIFASLVGPGYQQLKLLAVTVNSFGSAGTIVTGSYGSTGWHAVTFTAGAAGTYTLGLGCFNYSDQAVNPLLFVDEAAGGTSAPGQPVVSTTAASNVTDAAATTGGNVTSDGGATVTSRGVVYGTAPVPTLANSVVVSGSGLGSFTSSLSGLSSGTTYYVRSYATNSAGTSYGNEVSFTTQTICIPTAFTSCPSNITTNTTTNSCGTTVTYAPSASNGPTYTYAFSGATTGSGSGTGSGHVFNKGVTNVTVTATNACGTDQCSFTVTVTDNVNPVVAANNINAYLDANGSVTITPAQVNNGSSDNCGTLNLSLVGAGTTTGTICGAANENGTVFLTAPAGATITAINFASYGTPNGSCGNFTIGGCHAANSATIVGNMAIGQNSVAIPANNSTFGDPCFGTVKRLYVEATYQIPQVSSLTYTCGNLGANTVTLVGVDGSNNTASTTATVTVLDTVKPGLTVPANITVSCDGSTATGNTGMASTTDNCGATVSYVDASTQNPNNTDPGYYNYTITRTWTATDASNNSVSADQIITVQDVTSPGISVPQDVTVNCQDDNTPAANGTATGSDNCSPVTISFSDVSTQDANVNNNGHYNYTITRTWTATDVTGNHTSADQVITVQDVTNPGLTVPQNVTVNCQDDNTPTGTGTATGSDNCAPVTITYSDASTQNASNTSVAHYNYTITRTWTATDVTGNSTSADQIITVQDVTAPSINCPAATTVSCKTSVADNGTATGSDICSPVTITYSDASTQNSNPANSGYYNYTITRTWTATDVTGNYTTCDQVITVHALNTAAITVSPVNTINANHQNHTIYLGYGPQSVTLASTVQDGVGNRTYSWSPITGCANPGSATTSVSPLTSTTYTVTITDATGCSISESMPIQVIDVRCGNKVKICHFPPGNTGNPQQLCLPAAAIAAHLAHGCILGDCPQNKSSESNGEKEDNQGLLSLASTDVKVYPNPNNGVFTVELPAGLEQSEVVIMDMAGKVIQKKIALEGNKLQFDLGGVARGVYMLHLTNGSQNIRTRISVQ